MQEWAESGRCGRGGGGGEDQHDIGPENVFGYLPVGYWGQQAMLPQSPSPDVASWLIIMNFHVLSLFTILKIDTNTSIITREVCH